MEQNIFKITSYYYVLICKESYTCMYIILLVCMFSNAPVSHFILKSVQEEFKCL